MSTPRQIRRAEARAAAKQARKQLRSQPSGFDLATHDRIAAELDHGLEEVERLLAEQESRMTAADPRGASLSGCTPALQPAPPQRRGGPNTEAGKAKSSLNNLKHGLAGRFRVMGFESQAEFDALAQSLTDEHKPEGETEDLLVRKMAEHLWLSRRAQLLTDISLDSGNEREISLHMRYGITNDRAFSRCLNDLLKVRREKRAAAKEFESQKAKAAETTARVRLANARATALELDNERKKVRQHPPQTVPATAKATQSESQTPETELPAAA